MTKANGATLKAISIRQPWAELILRSVKPVENRSWHVKGFTGPLLIHVAQKMDWPGYRKHYVSMLGYGKWDIRPRGYIAGICNVTEITQEIKSEWHEAGQWGWYLGDVVRFETPIYFKGRLSLFNVSVDILPKEFR